MIIVKLKHHFYLHIVHSCKTTYLYWRMSAKNCFTPKISIQNPLRISILVMIPTMQFWLNMIVLDKLVTSESDRFSSPHLVLENNNCTLKFKWKCYNMWIYFVYMTRFDIWIEHADMTCVYNILYKQFVPDNLFAEKFRFQIDY